MRGNNRQPIFGTPEDMNELKRAFFYTHERYPFTILAWCFMTNHYHILIKPKEDSLSKIMAMVNRRYCHSYSKRYNHVGRIYQRRFFAKEIGRPGKGSGRYALGAYLEGVDGKKQAKARLVAKRYQGPDVRMGNVDIARCVSRGSSHSQAISREARVKWPLCSLDIKNAFRQADGFVAGHVFVLRASGIPKILAVYGNCGRPRMG